MVKYKIWLQKKGKLVSRTFENEFLFYFLEKKISFLLQELQLSMLKAAWPGGLGQEKWVLMVILLTILWQCMQWEDVCKCCGRLSWRQSVPEGWTLMTSEPARVLLWGTGILVLMAELRLKLNPSSKPQKPLNPVMSVKNESLLIDKWNSCQKASASSWNLRR